MDDRLPFLLLLFASCGVTVSVEFATKAVAVAGEK